MDDQEDDIVATDDYIAGEETVSLRQDTGYQDACHP